MLAHISYHVPTRGLDCQDTSVTSTRQRACGLYHHHAPSISRTALETFPDTFLAAVGQAENRLGRSDCGRSVDDGTRTPQPLTAARLHLSLLGSLRTY